MVILSFRFMLRPQRIYQGKKARKKSIAADQAENVVSIKSASGQCPCEHIQQEIHSQHITKATLVRFIGQATTATLGSHKDSTGVHWAKHVTESMMLRNIMLKIQNQRTHFCLYR